jgi:hypothetical protein
MDNVRAQLEAGKARSASFSLIVAEYMQSMHRLQELEIRNAQLDREASELRRENDTLLERATFASQTTAAAAEVRQKKHDVCFLFATQLQVLVRAPFACCSFQIPGFCMCARRRGKSALMIF